MLQISLLREKSTIAYKPSNSLNSSPRVKIHNEPEVLFPFGRVFKIQHQTEGQVTEQQRSVRQIKENRKIRLKSREREMNV